MTVDQPREYSLDFLGIRTRTEFYRGMPGFVPPPESPIVTPPLPAFDEEYFEWTDVFESVGEATTEFVMVELGAGYGRWTVRGAVVAKRRGLSFHGIAIEADPDHFRWLKQHCRDNELEEGRLELIWAAVHAEPGFVPFRVGRSDASYGQRVQRHSASTYPDARARRRLRARSALGRPPSSSGSSVSNIWVPCVTTLEALAAYPHIDFMDVDVQGLEGTVLAAAIDLLDTRVRRLHVGTHSSELEGELRALFTAHGWVKVHDYACHSQVTTRYGPIEFADGVQTWINPRLEPSSTPGVPRYHQRDAPNLDGSPTSVRPASVSLTTHVDVLSQQVRSLEHQNQKLRDKNTALRAKLRHVRGRYQGLKQGGRRPPGEPS
jgi:FkbM family methyltransferase